MNILLRAITLGSALVAGYGLSQSEGRSQENRTAASSSITDKKINDVDIKPILVEAIKQNEKERLSRYDLLELARRQEEAGNKEAASVIRRLATERVIKKDKTAPSGHRIRVIEDIFIRADQNSNNRLELAEVEQLGKDGKVTFRDLEELKRIQFPGIKDLLFDLLKDKKSITKDDLLQKANDLEKNSKDREAGLLRRLATSFAFKQLAVGGALGESQIYELSVGDGDPDDVTIEDIIYLENLSSKTDDYIIRKSGDMIFPPTFPR